MSPDRVRRFFVRTIVPHIRAVRPVALPLALCCCLSAAHSQWLEQTIFLPDAVGKWAWRWCLVYDSTNNTIYVGAAAGDCVSAINGATNQRIAQVPSASDAQALCYNPTDNKVHSANHYIGNVTVIDGAADSITTTVPAGGVNSGFSCRIHIRLTASDPQSEGWTPSFVRPFPAPV